MAYITKSDYFTGVFLVTILKTAKTVPMICDALNDTRCVVFDTDIGNFNVFVKYSTSQKEGWDYTKKVKTKRTYWNVPFTSDEYLYLLNSFEQPNKNNLTAIVCTDSKHNDTKIAILKLDEVKECLYKQTDSHQRRITVSRTGNAHRFDCFGVGISHNKAEIRPYVNHLLFFENEDYKNEE